MNAICCHHRGHKPDNKRRGGIMKAPDGISFTWHCFNCGFKCAFHVGQTISGNTKKLLEWSGVDQLQITAWSLESLKNKDILDLLPKKDISVDSFESMILPDGILVEQNTKFSEYITNRCLPSDFPFMITPDDPNIRNRNSIVIPYTYENKIVGYTRRFLDNKNPKYLNHQPAGFVFGLDNQQIDWKYSILTEGILDAISIDGCALMHNEISNMQSKLLAKLNKQIIFVPDQDKTGLSITDRALQLGYMVSIPPWNVKDPNDAVCKYGKLNTIAAIIQYATSSRIKVELSKRHIKD